MSHPAAPLGAALLPSRWVPAPSCRARACAAPCGCCGCVLRRARSWTVGEPRAAEVTAGRRDGGSMAASLWLRGAASGLRYWSRRQQPAAASLAAGKDLAPSSPVGPLASRFSRPDGRRGLSMGGAAIGSGLKTQHFNRFQGLRSSAAVDRSAGTSRNTLAPDPVEWSSAPLLGLRWGWKDLGVK